MKLEKFNHYNKYLILNSDSGNWLESESSERKVSGIGDYIENEIVALLAKERELFLLVGEQEFNVNDKSLTLMYEHNSNSTTRFSVINEHANVELNYISWWEKEAGLAAYETGGDEEEDICAYIAFMLASEQRRQHLLSKFL